MTLKFSRRAIVAAAAALSFASPVHAGGHQVVDSIHFLIPGGAGGGWDGTARGTGEALTNAGLVGSASFENMSGGGGGKANQKGKGGKGVGWNGTKVNYTPGSDTDACIEQKIIRWLIENIK